MNTWQELRTRWRSLPYLLFTPDNLRRIVELESRAALAMLSPLGLTR